MMLIRKVLLLLEVLPVLEKRIVKDNCTFNVHNDVLRFLARDDDDDHDSYVSYDDEKDEEEEVEEYNESLE